MMAIPKLVTRHRVVGPFRVMLQKDRSKTLPDDPGPMWFASLDFEDTDSSLLSDEDFTYFGERMIGSGFTEQEAIAELLRVLREGDGDG
jgi:hypothetical protein